MFPYVIFFTIFVEAPYSYAGGPWASAQFAPPPLKSGPDKSTVEMPFL